MSTLSQISDRTCDLNRLHKGIICVYETARGTQVQLLGTGRTEQEARAAAMETFTQSHSVACDQGLDDGILVDVSPELQYALEVGDDHEILEALSCLRINSARQLSFATARKAA